MWRLIRAFTRLLHNKSMMRSSRTVGDSWHPLLHFVVWDIPTESEFSVVVWQIKGVQEVWRDKSSYRCRGCTKWLLFNKEISKLNISYIIWGNFELNPKLKYVLYNKLFILYLGGWVHFNPCVFIYFILVIAVISPTEFNDLAKD